MWPSTTVGSTNVSSPFRQTPDLIFFEFWGFFFIDFPSLAVHHCLTERTKQPCPPHSSSCFPLSFFFRGGGELWKLFHTIDQMPKSSSFSLSLFSFIFPGRIPKNWQLSVKCNLLSRFYPPCVLCVCVCEMFVYFEVVCHAWAALTSRQNREISAHRQMNETDSVWVPFCFVFSPFYMFKGNFHLFHIGRDNRKWFGACHFSN